MSKEAIRVGKDIEVGDIPWISNLIKPKSQSIGYTSHVQTDVVANVTVEVWARHKKGGDLILVDTIQLVEETSNVSTAEPSWDEFEYRAVAADQEIKFITVKVFGG